MRDWLQRIPARLLLALLVVQAGYWLAFYPNFVSPPPPPIKLEPATTSDFQWATGLSQPTYEALQEAKFGPVPEELPFFIDRGYHASRTIVDVADIPPEGMGLLLGDSAANRRAYVNGELVYGDGDMDLSDLTHHGNNRDIIRVPASMLRKGSNRIEVLMTMEYAEDGVIFPAFIAPYSDVSIGYRWQIFLWGPLQVASLATGIVVTLLSCIVWLRSDRRGVWGWLTLLSLAWTVSAMVIVWVDLPLRGQGLIMFYLTSILTMGLSWPLLVDSWSGEQMSGLRLAALAGAIVGLGAIIWHIGIAFGPGSYEAAETVLRWIGLACLLAMILRLLWHFTRRREDKYWEAALLISMGVIFGSALWKSWDDAIGTVEFTRTQPLFLLLFMIAFVGRNFRLFRSQEQINSLLQLQLAERTAELEEAHLRERELVRHQAHHEERGRIMRDMHDGLGSNLMSMLLAARRGVAEPAAVAEGLQSVVDEMRLMIDSMDSVGESLATALATFRARIADRVTGAGFKLDWQDNATRPLPNYSPRTVLQVFRIMQEAVTNALKHSGGDGIAVSIADAPLPDDALMITIADNGSGRLGKGNSRGRGLDNMRSRTAMIGATIAFDESDTGLQVRLTLPRSAAGAA